MSFSAVVDVWGCGVHFLIEKLIFPSEHFLHFDPLPDVFCVSFLFVVEDYFSVFFAVL